MDWLQDGLQRFEEWAPARVPDVVLAIVVLLLGYLVARLLSGLAARLLRRWSLGLVSVVERVSRRHGLASELSRDEAEDVAVRWAGRIVFWLVFTLFLASATALVGVPVVSAWLAGLASYLPRVLAAAAIVLLGLLAGHLVRILVISGAASARLPYATTMGRALQSTTVVIAIVIAIEQLGIETTFLIVLAAIGLAAILGACALAFGLGARGEVGNMVACHYLSRVYQVGHRVRVGDHEGVITEITPTAVVVRTSAGRAVIPAQLFSSQVTLLLTADSQ